jgi:hypothetical protein
MGEGVNEERVGGEGTEEETRNTWESEARAGRGRGR